MRIFSMTAVVEIITTTIIIILYLLPGTQWQSKFVVLYTQLQVYTLVHSNGSHTRNANQVQT